MTVHETELTFLRCPGCRSLVPPSATRCRMCGEALSQQQQPGESAGTEGADALNKKSRVRQRTMSLPPDQVEDAKEQFQVSTKPEPEELAPLRAEQAKPVERMTFSAPAAEPERPATRAPQPFKLGAGQLTPPSRGPVADSTVSDHVNIAERITKDLESDLEAEASPQRPGSRGQEGSQKLGFRVQTQPPAAESEESDEGEDDGEDEGDDEEDVSLAADAAQQAPRKKRRRRRKRKKGPEAGASGQQPHSGSTEPRTSPPRTDRSEFISAAASSSGMSQTGGRSGQGSLPRSGAPVPPTTLVEPMASDAPAAPVAPTARDMRTEPPFSKSEGSRFTESASPLASSRGEPVTAAEPLRSTRQPEESRSVPRDERQTPPVRESAPSAPAPSAQRPEMPSAKSEPHAQRGKAVEPRTQLGLDEESALVGWFVNYEVDKKGVATEIRGGRFFVCGERLKDSDLVVTEPSISTPHCVIKAQAGAGLKVQDLLSEKGTFVRKSGEDKFYQFSESVNVEHGDWLRFGDYEVLVCLVSLPKRR